MIKRNHENCESSTITTGIEALIRVKTEKSRTNLEEMRKNRAYLEMIMMRELGSSSTDRNGDLWTKMWKRRRKRDLERERRRGE